MDVSELFWNSSIEDIKKGYIYDEKEERFTCIICGKTYEKGIIYKEEDNYYEAEKWMKLHIEKDHGSTFEYIINMNKRYTGLTDIQKEFLTYYKDNLSDKDMSKKMRGSQSTIRNHRFKLREKEKQAKIFLALMSIIDESLEKKPSYEDKENLVTVHKSAAMVDERFAVTEKERETIIKNYFDNFGHLKEFPSKEKRKIIVLNHILNNFQQDRKYSEQEINRILERIFDDYVSLRRALIEYGFMDRKSDCSLYWVKE